MKDSRLRHLIERTARNRGIPAELSHEIVDLAQHRLRASASDQPPRRSDIVQTVDEVQREWSGRLLTALDSFSA
ncbi:MAG: hypothetical protein AAF560_26295 [Acidobacteriota bacterium]